MADESLPGSSGSSKVDIRIHVKKPAIAPEERESLDRLRELIHGSDEYQKACAETRAEVTDHMLHRYLRARQGDVKKAASMLQSSVSWFEEKKPWAVDIRLIECEYRTGKFYALGHVDRWGRPVIVFDNTVQNTAAVSGQMDGLIFTLLRGIRLMPPDIEKYVIFINLTNFSMRNMPPWAATSETLRTLQEQLPERLGHVVLYQTPWVFQTLFNMVKPLLDPVTAGKVVFLNGDDSAGSANDEKMKALLGDGWRQWTNAGAPPVFDGCSPGYDHRSHWPQVLQQWLQWRKEDGRPVKLEDEKKFLTEAEGIKLGDLPKEPDGYLAAGVPMSSAEGRAIPISEKKPESTTKKGWFW